MIYNINKVLGWLSNSGVEYAQVYRHEAFHNQVLPHKFIFLEQTESNFLTRAQNMGYEQEDVLELHNLFSDITIKNPELTYQEISAKYGFTEENPLLTYQITFDKVNELKVDYIDVYVNNQRVRRDHFSYVLTHSNFYVDNKRVSVIWYNEDGSNALEFLVDGNVYGVPGFGLITSDELITLGLKRMNIQHEDTILVDRALGVINGIVQGNVNKAKLGIMVHAEHFIRSFVSDKYVLWNNHYEYPLQHSHLFDYIIVATDQQRFTLMKQLQLLQLRSDNVVTVPVGNIKVRHKKSNHIQVGKRFMTASRLTAEKNLSLLIQAFVQAYDGQSSLDIYGEGSSQQQLQQLIESLHATSYIKLKGHQSLEQIYPQYDFYISASKGEGFGLTLMEAVSNSLIMIGFNVPYGNQVFIQPGINGFLIDYVSDDNKNRNNLADVISRVNRTYSNNQLLEMSNASFQLAESYLLENVGDQWRTLLAGSETINENTTV
ncbi:glycosyltransferase [Weissella paramesenteroides]|uniref:glycosyltransferase n=1 Tax=Weissella paramesenteroides TaxID=1249 RepID=UPI003890E510